MTRIGFLACAETLPADAGGTGERRGDAFEHDLEVAALRPAFADAGLELVEIDWRAPLGAFKDLSLILLGTAWDYQDNSATFLARLQQLAARGVMVLNAPEVVRWNLDKRYLRQLAEAGASTVPTLWYDDPGSSEVLDAMDQFGCERVVVKRQIGAGALGQHNFTREDPPTQTWRMGRAAMIQPFLPAIVEEGEYSFIFIDGIFSHGVLKRPAEGDYRIQSLFGGREEVFVPSREDLTKAQQIMSALPFSDLLYARIDMVRLGNGQLAVMEAELIEPYLYPQQGPGIGDRLASAICDRLRRPS